MAARLRSLCFCVATSVAGCSTGEPGITAAPVPTPVAVEMPSQAPPAPSTYREVAPILVRRCLGCHVQGGVGPFPLETFEEAQSHHAAIASAVVARVMPPWLPAEGC